MAKKKIKIPLPPKENDTPFQRFHKVAQKVVTSPKKGIQTKKNKCI